MSSTTASDAVSLLNTYGGNNNLISAIVKQKDVTEQQAAEIVSLKKQLAALSASNSTSSTNSATGYPYANYAAYGANGNNTMSGMNPLMMMMMNSYPGMNSMMNNQSQGNSLAALTSSGQPVNLQQLQQAMNQNKTALQQKLAQICQANGVNTNQQFAMNLDSNGQIVITGDNANKDKLQAALRADSNFTQLFKDTKEFSDYFAKLSAASS